MLQTCRDTTSEIDRRDESHGANNTRFDTSPVLLFALTELVPPAAARAAVVDQAATDRPPTSVAFLNPVAWAIDQMTPAAAAAAAAHDTTPC